MPEEAPCVHQAEPRLEGGRSRRCANGAVAVVAVFVLAACAPAPTSAPRSPSGGTASGRGRLGQAKIAARAGQAIHVVLQPTHGPVGTRVAVLVSGLSPGTEASVEWQQVTGTWHESATGVFSGSTYAPSLKPLLSVDSGPSRRVSTSFVVPAAFGGPHSVAVVRSGRSVAIAAFDVATTASITPRAGPVGTPIKVVMTGIGWKPYHQNYDVAYDNRMTGWMSAVTTLGAATAVIPATGVPGFHDIRIYESGDRVPYLNPQQGAVPLSTFDFAFTVTMGAPVLPGAALSQTPAAVPAPAPVRGAGPQVWLNDAAGPPGTPLVLSGAQFPRRQTYSVHWYTLRGNHILGSQVVEETLASARTGIDGRLRVAFDAPADLQGAHRIVVVAGAATAGANFVMTPEVLPLQPESGPSGTPITIRLRGTGWTETGNIYTVVYDNAYLGFGCGFNSHGDITIHLTASGGPGWHFIELLPSVWKVSGLAVGSADYIQVPQLTYASDHPGEHLPGFELAFDVVG